MVDWTLQFLVFYQNNMTGNLWDEGNKRDVYGK